MLFIFQVLKICISFNLISFFYFIFSQWSHFELPLTSNADATTQIKTDDDDSADASACAKSLLFSLRATPATPAFSNSFRIKFCRVLFSVWLKSMMVLHDTVTLSDRLALQLITGVKGEYVDVVLPCYVKFMMML